MKDEVYMRNIVHVIAAKICLQWGIEQKQANNIANGDSHHGLVKENIIVVYDTEINA